MGCNRVGGIPSCASTPLARLPPTEPGLMASPGTDPEFNSYAVAVTAIRAERQRWSVARGLSLGGPALRTSLPAVRPAGGPPSARRPGPVVLREEVPGAALLHRAPR